MTRILFGVLFLTVVVFQYITAPPVGKEEKAAKDEYMYNTEGLTKEQAQDQEYFRYLTQVVGELEKDPDFKKVLNNASEEDIRSGKIAERVDLVGHGIRQKLDEIKRMEVEYQRDLLKQKKDHMTGIDRNYWNPIHHDDQETFTKEDLKKLLSKHNDMMNEQDEQRKKDFKKYELEKEHERREKMKNMTDTEREKEEKHHKEVQFKPHEKMHEPGHKAQLEEVWEKEDGLDADSFDPRTFFKLHDKNSDGYLDMFELETLFLVDIDKVYNESDPDVDLKEREEELARMREHVTQNMDTDKDGLISFDEFMSETNDKDFEEDKDWEPLVDKDQYSEEELKEYEKMLEEEEKNNEHQENSDHDSHTS